MKNFIMTNDLVERLLYITLLMVFIVAGILFYNNVQSNKRFQERQKDINTQLATEAEVLKNVQSLVQHQGDTTADINRSISCVLTFFTVPNRTNFYISDLNTCTVTETSTGRTRQLDLPTPTSNNTGTNSSAGSGAAATPPATQPSQPTPTTPAPTTVTVPVLGPTLLPQPICLLGLLCVQ